MRASRLIYAGAGHQFGGEKSVRARGLRPVTKVRMLVRGV
jgi:hypothetical protein